MNLIAIGRAARPDPPRKPCPGGRFLLAALPVAALVGPWGIATARGQESPAIRVDLLRREGVQGFEPAPPRDAAFQSRAHGVLGSGWAVPLEPGEAFEFTLQAASAAPGPFWSPDQRDGGALAWTETIAWMLAGGTLSRSASGQLRARAPTTPGNHRLSLTIQSSIRLGETELPGPTGLTAEITLLVKAPFDRNGNGLIAGYPIGIYPNEAGAEAPSFVRQHQRLYAPPQSFILVTPEVERLPVSEHYALGDFSPASERGRPHYIALDRRLIEFLEAATEELKTSLASSGATAPLRILTAFLSPNHLAQLRAQGVAYAPFTRYQYGDGAAVVWDGDGDGLLDDLDGSGTVDVADAGRLADLLAETQRQLGKFGGVGAAAAPRNSQLPATPYVDVDLRGVASRW